MSELIYFCSKIDIMSLKEFFLGTKVDSNTDTVNWKKLNGVDQLNELTNSPLNQKIIIFKHSPRCGISSTVLRKFEAKLLDKNNDDLVYLVNVLSERELSMALAAKYQIVHQSPQVLVIKNEKVVGYASHYDILDMEI
jgi:bacillithiol system protein YtxJ